MSINLVLHSTDAISYTAGTASFYVNWNNFYEDDPYATYKVSFSFHSEPDANISGSDVYQLYLEGFGTTLRTIEGTGNGGNSNNSLAIGFLEVVEIHNQQDQRLLGRYSTNPPVNIQGRPQGNMITIAIRDLNKAKPIPAIIPKFVVFLRFEKI